MALAREGRGLDRWLAASWHLRRDPCSALKRNYRDFLTSGRPEVRVVYLQGEKAMIAARLDVVLVGAGIMSATVGTMLKELDPSLSIVMASICVFGSSTMADRVLGLFLHAGALSSRA